MTEIEKITKSNEETSTIDEPIVEKKKDPKKVRAGRELAKKNREAKEAKKREEESEKYPWVTTHGIFIAIGLSIVGFSIFVLNFKNPKVKQVFDKPGECYDAEPEKNLKQK